MHFLVSIVYVWCIHVFNQERPKLEDFGRKKYLVWIKNFDIFSFNGYPLKVHNLFLYILAFHDIPQTIRITQDFNTTSIIVYIILSFKSCLNLTKRRGQDARGELRSQIGGGAKPGYYFPPSFSFFFQLFPVSPPFFPFFYTIF